MEAEVIEVDSQNPDEEKLKKAAQIIKRGGTVAFPTDTVYGLGVNALDEKAVEKIFEIKGRGFDKPLIGFPPSIAYFDNLLEKMPSKIQGLAKKLAARFWPGPLSIVVPFPKDATLNISKKASSSLGLRIPDSQVTLLLLKLLRLPLATTSANLSGSPSSISAKEVQRQLGDKIDLIIDAGSTKHQAVSTVLDLTTQPPSILRRGAISSSEIESFLQKIS